MQQLCYQDDMNFNYMNSFDNANISLKQIKLERNNYLEISNKFTNYNLMLCLVLPD
jgi:hypothetical protein